MKNLLPCAVFCSTALLQFGFTPFAQEEQAEVEHAEVGQTRAKTGTQEAKQSLSPVERATRLTQDHGSLRYTIYNYQKTIGEYALKTKLSILKNGNEVIDLVDYYNYFRNEESTTRQTRALLNENFDFIEISANTGQYGGVGVKMINGFLVGNDLKGEAFKHKAPKHMLTRDLLQRGIYDLPKKKGESIEVEMFALVTLMIDDRVKTDVTILCRGKEEVVAQGVTYNCLKYVVRVAGEKSSTQYWFGPELRMIKMHTGSKTWELMPKGQKKPLPVERKPNPKRQRENNAKKADAEKKAKQEDK